MEDKTKVSKCKVGGNRQIIYYAHMKGIPIERSLWDDHFKHLPHLKKYANA